MKKYNIYLIFALALGLRLLFGLAVQNFQLTADGEGYNAIAVNLANLREFSIEPGKPTPTRAPLYPFFLSLIYYLAGHNFVFVMILQSLIDSVTCLFIYFIALTVLEEKYAFLPALIYSAYPVMIAYTNMLLSETIFTFLFSLTIFLLISAFKNNSMVKFMLSGTVLGLSTLARGTTLIFPVFVLFMFLIYKKSLYKWIVFTLFMLIVISPWAVRNYLLFNKFIPVGTIGTGLGIWVSGYQASGQGGYEDGLAKGRAMGTNFPPDYIEYEKQLTTEGLKLIKKHPFRYILIVAERLPKFWFSSHSSLFGIDKSIPAYLQNKDYIAICIRLALFTLHAFFILSAIGSIFLGIKSYTYSSILVIALIYFTGHILFDPCPRYHLPVMPYIFIYSSFTTLNLFNKIRMVKSWKG